MREFVASIGSWIADPRKMFAVAALCAAAGIVLAYIAFHDRADRELALRRGAPPQVALQDFSPVRNVGPADEVFVAAEADFGAAVTLTIPGSEPIQSALVVPLYALSDIGAALTEAASDERAGALTAQVARRTDGPSPEKTMALGYAIHPLTSDVVPQALAEREFGQGRNGTVVTVNGTLTDPGAFALMAAGAFIALEIDLPEKALAVQPFINGRVSALSSTRSDRLYILLLVAAAGLAIAAVAITLRRMDRSGDAELPSRRAGDPEPEVHTAHPKFAPIPSQREIIEAELRVEGTASHRAMRTAAAVLHGAWVVALALASILAATFRWIRSRLSRPEDEVL